MYAETGHVRFISVVRFLMKPGHAITFLFEMLIRGNRGPNAAFMVHQRQFW